MTESFLPLEAIVEAAGDLCGVTPAEMFAKRPGHADRSASRARLLAVVVAVRSNYRSVDVEHRLGFSSALVSQLIARFKVAVRKGDACLALAADTVAVKAARIAAAGGPSVVLPGVVRPPKQPRPAQAKPGPKPKPAPPKERVLAPTDLLPAHEVAEAQRLRKEGWSFKGLTRRFELPEREMRIVVGEPLL